MFTYFCQDLIQLLNYNLHQLTTFRGLFDWTWFFLYFVDVGFGSMSYVMSLRLMDTHIRSTEPTALGWVAALICYQPFWSLISHQYLDYDEGRAWGDIFAGVPLLYDLWGCLILALVGIYVWATISFGARFSNLTHRGIITTGPYRFTKHPAYLAKNLSWWLISMPLLAGGSLAETLRRCAVLLMLNGLYYVRAKTEERHLAQDPAYLQYARWIQHHGLLRFVDRAPLLRALARWCPGFPGPLTAG